MQRMNDDGVIYEQCSSLGPRIEDGKIRCSTWVGFEDLPSVDLCSGKFEGIEVAFDLSDIVDSFIGLHAYTDGLVSPEAKPTLMAIRAELDRMASKIDALEYGGE